MDPGERLYRDEFGRIVAALTRAFGLANFELAEDVAQDTFCRALEVWALRGVPENPPAWLMKAAKNRAIDVLRRERRARSFSPELKASFDSEWTLVPTVGRFFEGDAIDDDELRMVFSCCNPGLSETTRIALTLNVCCGFTAGEVAALLFDKREAVERRVARGKKTLASSQRLFDLTGADLPERLRAVQRVIYLLFSQGYHGASARTAVRAELCREAIRLGTLLIERDDIATPATYALCALMAFGAARLPARVDGAGDLVSLTGQDRRLWDRTLIARGLELLERSASGPQADAYHLEAAIAAAHCTAESSERTDWNRIVWLYDLLLRRNPSPVVALNRAIAVAHRDGPQSGIEQIRSIDSPERLASYPFYCAALGELEMRVGNAPQARRHFEAALAVARNAMERRFLESKIAAI